MLIRVYPMLVFSYSYIYIFLLVTSYLATNIYFTYTKHQKRR